MRSREISSRFYKINETVSIPKQIILLLGSG